MLNDFSKLDAQSDVSRLAQIHPNEIQDPAEFDAWLAGVAQHNLGFQPEPDVRFEDCEPLGTTYIFDPNDAV